MTDRWHLTVVGSCEREALIMSWHVWQHLLLFLAANLEVQCFGDVFQIEKQLIVRHMKSFESFLQVELQHFYREKQV